MIEGNWCASLTTLASMNFKCLNCDSSEAHRSLPKNRCWSATTDYAHRRPHADPTIKCTIQQIVSVSFWRWHKASAASYFDRMGRQCVVVIDSHFAVISCIFASDKCGGATHLPWSNLHVHNLILFFLPNSASRRHTPESEIDFG